MGPAERQLLSSLGSLGLGSADSSSAIIKDGVEKLTECLVPYARVRFDV